MAFLLAAAAILGGRALRQGLLVDPQGAWRDPEWLAEVLPPLAAADDDESAPAPAILTGPLFINRCAADSLTLLPGVGPVLAGRIARARAEGVHFASAADLQKVKGIGASLAAKLASRVAFGPAAAPVDTTAHSANPADRPVP